MPLKTKQTLHFFWPNEAINYQGEYYIKRPWIKNELQKYFNVKIYCSVLKVNNIDGTVYCKINENIEVIDFFDKLEMGHVLKNYRKYNRNIKLSSSPGSDLYFVMYPYRKISIILAHMLSDLDLTIWVKSDYAGLFRELKGEGVKKYIKTVLSPVVSVIYPRLTKKIFKDNLIFYTGDIIYNKQDHITQNGIISLSRLNRNENLIHTEKKQKVIFVGDENKQKGLHLLLEALCKTEANLSLTILGSDSLDKYKDYHNVLDIEVVGEIYDHEKFYQKLSEHDILVMPSICERQGKVQLEAMSAGVVPICSDSGGTYTTITHLYNGILFKEKSVPDLESCLNRIYNNWELYCELQENGRRYVENKSLEGQVEKMTTVMKNYYGK